MELLSGKSCLSVIGIAAACLVALTSARSSIAQNVPGRYPPYEWLVQKLSLAETARLEHLLEQNPDDIDARIRLICAYVASAQNERRAKHLLWLIDHHPEASGLHTGLFVFPQQGPLQDVKTYHRAAELWKQQVIRHSAERQVILNGAEFLHAYCDFTEHDPFAAERWILRARDLAPTDSQWSDQLALDYMRALVFGRDGLQKEFAAHARAELDHYTDPRLLWQTGNYLVHSIGGSATAEVKELEAYGERLMKRAEELGFHPPAKGRPDQGAGK